MGALPAALQPGVKKGDVKARIVRHERRITDERGSKAAHRDRVVPHVNAATGVPASITR
jgi:hypothetical protein